MSFLSQRLRSFKFAFEGILSVFKTQANARIHLLATVLVFALAFYYSISSAEWIFLMLVISLVFITEFLNTAIESLGDAITKDQDERIKKAKDVGAGAVLLASICAVIVGLIIFIPKMLG